MSRTKLWFWSGTTRVRRPIGVLVALGMVTGILSPAQGATAKVVLRLAPTTVSVAQGSSVPVVLSVTRRNGFAAPLLVSGASVRAGLSIATDQNPVSGASANIRVSASPSAKTGRTTLTVKASGGGVTALTKLTVTITAAVGPPGVTPASLVLQPGESGSVGFQSVGSRTGVPVSFGAANLPTGLKVSITPSGTGARYLFTAAASTKRGSYAVTLRASQGGVIFYSVLLPITIGNPVVATAPGSTSLAASSTTPPLTLAPTSTVVAVTTAAPTSTVSAQTSTTSIASLPGGTTSQPVIVGADLVVTRIGAGGGPLRCSLSEPELGATVTVTFFNSATSPRVMSQQTACSGDGVPTESPAILTIPAGQSAVVTAKTNAKYIFRSANDGGLRRAIQVQRSGLVDVGGPMIVSVTCTGPAAYSTTVKLAQGERVILSNITPGSSCVVNDIDGWQIYWKSWDNSGANADGIVAIQQRPAGCAPATPTAPSQMNVNPPCWAEIRFSW